MNQQHQLEEAGWAVAVSDTNRSDGKGVGDRACTHKRMFTRSRTVRTELLIVTYVVIKIGGKQTAVIRHIHGSVYSV